MFVKPKEKISFDNIIKNMMDNVKGKINYDKQHQGFLSRTFKKHGIGKQFFIKEDDVIYRVEISVYNIEPVEGFIPDYEVE